ncbi:NAD synthetase [Klebsiella pneumoniae]|nr:NAD synthetase [Klebsiella pneumoniae]
MTLQQEIIQALGAKPQIDVAGEIRRSVDFLKSYLQTYPFIKSLVLGISGGQDSTDGKTVPDSDKRTACRNRRQ